MYTINYNGQQRSLPAHLACNTPSYPVRWTSIATSTVGVDDQVRMVLETLSAMVALVKSPAPDVARGGLRVPRSSHMDCRKCESRPRNQVVALVNRRCSGSSRSGGAPSQLTATFMANLIESGDLQRHISQTLQPAYARRYNIMVDAVKKELMPLGVTLPDVNRDVVGGYFIWIELPESLQAEEIAPRTEQEENLIVAPGKLFEVYGDDQGPDLKRKVRLCFSWEEENLLGEGIERLGKVISRLQHAQGPGQGVVQPPQEKFDAGDSR